MNECTNENLSYCKRKQFVHLIGVPVHTGTPVKYGPLEDEGAGADEWNLRETRVQVSYLHPDIIETRGM